MISTVLYLDFFLKSETTPRCASRKRRINATMMPVWRVAETRSAAALSIAELSAGRESCKAQRRAGGEEEGKGEVPTECRSCVRLDACCCVGRLARSLSLKSWGHLTTLWSKVGYPSSCSNFRGKTELVCKAHKRELEYSTHRKTRRIRNLT